MKYFIPVLSLTIIVLFSKAVIPQTGWISQTSGTSEHLRSVCFIDNNTGFAVGGGNTTVKLILKTTNAGDIWDMIYFQAGNNFTVVQFINSTTGFIGASDGNLMRTTNQGNSWSNVYNFGFHINSVFFLNQNTGYVACGTGGDRIYKTVNSGTNWVQLSGGISNIQGYGAVSFYNSVTGYLGAYVLNGSTYGAHILKTTTGGSSWEPGIFYPNKSIRSIYILNSNNVIAAGNNFIIKTTNGGNSWNEINHGYTYNFESISMADTNTGFICGYQGQSTGSLVIKTTNGGNNWFSVLQSGGCLLGIYFVNHNTGFTVGCSGSIWKTTTGGILTGFTNNNSYINNYELYQNFPNPFNPATRISFYLKKNEFVSLKIYDLNGKEVVSLINEEINEGSHYIDFDGSDLSSGIYLYQLKAGPFEKTMKMLLIK